MRWTCLLKIIMALNDFWNQKSQVEMFMTGIHADLRDKYQMPVTLGEFRSEILISDVTSMGEGYMVRL